MCKCGKSLCVSCETKTCSLCGKGPCACDTSKGESEIKSISVQDLLKKIESSSPPMVVNVLNKEQYEACHIKGSISAPLDELQAQAQSWDKQHEMVVYCASYECNASRSAFKMLKQIGFANVWAYEGGMKEWKEQGLSVDGACA